MEPWGEKLTPRQGFDSKGEVVVSNVAARKLTWEEIGRRSAKVIGFTDLAGHEKYRRLHTIRRTRHAD